jgi:hypothetical protein
MHRYCVETRILISIVIAHQTRMPSLQMPVERGPRQEALANRGVSRPNRNLCRPRSLSSNSSSPAILSRPRRGSEPLRSPSTHHDDQRSRRATQRAPLALGSRRRARGPTGSARPYKHLTSRRPVRVSPCFSPLLVSTGPGPPGAKRRSWERVAAPPAAPGLANQRAGLMSGLWSSLLSSRSPARGVGCPDCRECDGQLVRLVPRSFGAGACSEGRACGRAVQGCTHQI